MTEERLTRTDAERRIDDACAAVMPTETAWSERARERLDDLTKPPGSLGVLEDIAARVATVQRTVRPCVGVCRVIVMAGDHGVVAEGVSSYPSEVTAQMVANFVNGGAAINQLASWAGAQVVVVDVGVASDLSNLDGYRDHKVCRGTANMTQGPAMSRDQAARAMAVGIRLAAEAATDGVSLVGTGEMGIGNTTAAAAVTAVLVDRDPAEVVGPGTGLDLQGVSRKQEVVRRALAVNPMNPSDPLGVVAAVGGLEIAGLAGVVLGCAAEGLCVVCDGFISGAAALVACRMAPRTAEYLFPSHLSTEPGHRVVLEALGMRPVLQLDMRLGEGTGAALAMGVMDAACRAMSGMATFAEAGVSDRG